ncbi:hypothetical protein [Dactylosporangium sp. NPDC051484]|uniref:hypothetical protein n=1 Tax=Dactylosporangium sp. NPDC051484 TaxID=3154942 RepID=UPI00344DB0A7
MGYPEWESSRDGGDRQAPETGRWDLRQERWIPQQRLPDGDDFGIEPFPARSDPGRPGQGRVLDHEEWGTGYQRRDYPGPPPRRPSPPPRPPDDDDEYEDEPDQRQVYIGSFISTACWYLVPLAAYTAWSLTMSPDPRPGCTNAFGLPCPAPRTEALTNLMNTVPKIAVSMALSITIAMFLGRVTTGWRPYAIGFASAVLGAGVATVLFAVLATQF